MHISDLAKEHVLALFEDELAAMRFVSAAGRELRRTGVESPLLVSAGIMIDRLGPTGPGL